MLKIFTKKRREKFGHLNSFDINEYIQKSLSMAMSNLGSINITFSKARKFWMLLSFERLLGLFSIYWSVRQYILMKRTGHRFLTMWEFFIRKKNETCIVKSQ